MSIKRRDKKNRILRNGESQQKDGHYVFKYYDRMGKVHFVYSWKLEPTDITPQGKKEMPALRDKERVILRDLQDNISSFGGNLTVIELVEKYIMQKTGVRHNTMANYKFVLNIIKWEQFGLR